MFDFITDLFQDDTVTAEKQRPIALGEMGTPDLDNPYAGRDLAAERAMQDLQLQAQYNRDPARANEYAAGLYRGQY